MLSHHGWEMILVMSVPFWWIYHTLNSRKLLIIFGMEHQTQTHLLLLYCLDNAMATELTRHKYVIFHQQLDLDNMKGMPMGQIVEVMEDSTSMAQLRNVERQAFKELLRPTLVHNHNLWAYIYPVKADMITPRRQ